MSTESLGYLDTSYLDKEKVIESFLLSETWIMCPFSSCRLTGSPQCVIVPKHWTRNQESSLPLIYRLTFRKNLSPLIQNLLPQSKDSSSAHLTSELCECTKLYEPLFKS